MPEHSTIYIAFAAIGLLTFCCQWIAWRVKLPSILFLLFAGIFLGPITGWLHPDKLFGDLLFPFISVSVAIILFEGSLSLKFEEIKGHGTVVFNLVTFGVIITALLTALLAHSFYRLPWQIAAVFGAISAVSGPTVIIPLLRAVRLKRNLSNILRWEGILIDPIGAMLAILVFTFVIFFHDTGKWHVLTGHFLTTLFYGVAIGSGVAFLLAQAIKRHWVPDFLLNVSTLSLVIANFVLGEMVSEGAGLIAVTVMGITLANIKNLHIEEIIGFKETLSLWLISTLFILLAARVNFQHLLDIAVASFGFLAILMFVVRPLSVFICSIRSGLDWKEKLLLSWVCPRGIIAASIAALFALQLHLHGIISEEVSRLFILITFIVIIGTVVFQSITTRYLANTLGLSEPEPKGILMIGANPGALMIAKALQQEGYHVIVTSTDWHQTRLARMEGMDCYYGNPVSAHADRHLDLVGIGILLAMSPKTELNSIACMKYRSEFGSNQVFTLPTHTSEDKQSIDARFSGQHLFNAEMTYDRLQHLATLDTTIKGTLLSDSFDIEAYKAQYPLHIPLFALDNKERLRFFTMEHNLNPSSGWKLFSLVPNNEK